MAGRKREKGSASGPHFSDSFTAMYSSPLFAPDHTLSIRIYMSYMSYTLRSPGGCADSFLFAMYIKFDVRIHTYRANTATEIALHAGLACMQDMHLCACELHLVLSECLPEQRRSRSSLSHNHDPYPILLFSEIPCRGFGPVSIAPRPLLGGCTRCSG